MTANLPKLIDVVASRIDRAGRDLMSARREQELAEMELKQGERSRDEMHIKLKAARENMLKDWSAYPSDPLRLALIRSRYDVDDDERRIADNKLTNLRKIVDEKREVAESCRVKLSFHEKRREKLNMLDEKTRITKPESDEH